MSKPKLALAKHALNHQRKSSAATGSINGFSSSCAADLMPSISGPSSTQHRSFSASQRAGSQPSTSSQANASPKLSERFPIAHSTTTPSSGGRRLQMVLVMDLKQQKYLKIRELACKNIEAVAESLNVHLNVGLTSFLISGGIGYLKRQAPDGREIVGGSVVGATKFRFSVHRTEIKAFGFSVYNENQSPKFSVV